MRIWGNDGCCGEYEIGENMRRSLWEVACEVRLRWREGILLVNSHSTPGNERTWRQEQALTCLRIKKKPRVAWTQEEGAELRIWAQETAGAELCRALLAEGDWAIFLVQWEALRSSRLVACTWFDLSLLLPKKFFKAEWIHFSEIRHLWIVF